MRLAPPIQTLLAMYNTCSVSHALTELPPRIEWHDDADDDQLRNCDMGALVRVCSLGDHVGLIGICRRRLPFLQDALSVRLVS